MLKFPKQRKCKHSVHKSKQNNQHPSHAQCCNKYSLLFIDTAPWL